MNDFSLSVFDGLMLGDGSVSKNSNNYAHTCKNVDYLVLIQRILRGLNIPFRSKMYWRGELLNSWSLNSRVCDFLKEQRKRWYPNNIKIVPQDVIIDKFSLAHWYIGDGTLSSTHNYLCGIKFAAHCFSYEERDYLVKKMRSAGLKSIRNTTFGEIWINKSGVQTFLDYIEECPSDFYSYKWDLSRFWRTTRLRHSEKKKLVISSEAP